MATMQPFSVHVDETVLFDLRQRLARTRWPDLPGPPSWQAGMHLGELRSLCDYWQSTFDWRAAESRLNQWQQFTVDLDGETIHFIHERSPRPSSIPLLLLHGWPSTSAEFSKVILSLTEPVADRAADAPTFHVVAPSIPGYGFSGPLRQAGWGPAQIGDAFAQLMTSLGYDRYVVHGGDWGTFIAQHMGSRYRDSMIGLHLNLPSGIGVPPLAEGDDIWHEMTEEERRDVRWATKERSANAGYVAIQSTKPDVLSVGLTDSPAGLAAWILDKLRSWSDCDGDVLRAFTIDEILTVVTTYWVTSTLASSVRLYFELAQGTASSPDFVSVPTAFAAFPKDPFRRPRRQLEGLYNIVRWTEMKHGGHFPAHEQPDLLVNDIRQFVSDLGARESTPPLK